ncbi:MAG: hypothetical protein ACK5G7_05535 [Erysipelotrichaceae bacterium]
MRKSEMRIQAKNAAKISIQENFSKYLLGIIIYSGLLFLFNLVRKNYFTVSEALNVLEGLPLVFSVNSVLGNILELISNAVIAPVLSYGVYKTFRRIQEHKEVQGYACLFDAFKDNFKNIIWVNFIINLLIYGLNILIMLIGLFVFLPIIFNGDYVSTILPFVFFVLIVIMVVVSVFIMIRFVFANLILVDNANESLKSVFAKSKELTKNSFGDIIIFHFSFFGWVILVGFLKVFCLMIPVIGGVLFALLSAILTIYQMASLINLYDLYKGDKVEIVSEKVETVLLDN